MLDRSDEIHMLFDTMNAVYRHLDLLLVFTTYVAIFAGMRFLIHSTASEEPVRHHCSKSARHVCSPI